MFEEPGTVYIGDPAMLLASARQTLAAHALTEGRCRRCRSIGCDIRAAAIVIYNRYVLNPYSGGTAPL